MANPTDAFKKDIILNLVSQISGDKEVNAFLKKYNKQLTKTSKAQKTFYETARAMGGILRTSAKIATAAVAGLGVMLKRTGNTMLKFELSSIGAASAIDRLEKSYANMSKSSNIALVSLQDIATTLTKFQSKGIAEKVLAMGDGFKEGLIGLQGLVSKGVGKSTGSGIAGDVLESLGDQFGHIEKVMAASKIGAKETIAALQAAIPVAKDKNSIQNSISAIEAGMKRKGMTAPIRSMNDALAEIGTILEGLEADFTKVFGDDVATLIDKLSKIAQTLIKRFKAWGGINKLVQISVDLFEKAKSTFILVKDTIVNLANAFMNFGTVGKAAIVGLVAYIGSSNIRGLINGIGKSAWAAGKHFKSIGFAKSATLIGQLGAVGAAAAAAGFMVHQLSAMAAGEETYGGRLVDKHYGYEDKEAATNKKGNADLLKALGMTQKEYDTKQKKLRDENIKADNARIAALKKVKKATEEVSDATEESGRAQVGAAQSFEYALGKLKEYDIVVSGLSSSLGSMETIVSLLGPKTSILGKNIGAMLGGAAGTSVATAFDALREAAKTIKTLEGEMKGASSARKAELAVMQQDAYERAAAAATLLDKAQKSALAPLEKSKDILATSISLRQADLDIAQQLYGTPALAVQAQLNLVQMMEERRKLVLEQIKVQDGIIAGMIAEKATAEDLEEPMRRKVELQAEARDIQVQELKNIKELRDGYLDAVKAQAFGAGMFSKILITQDQNIMRGMQENAVKRNYLLGQYGQDSSRTMAKSYRFSAMGMGRMDGAEGAGKTRIDGIADPAARAAARQATALAQGVAGGGRGAIDAYAQKNLGGIGMRALGRGSNAAGQTAFGMGMNRGADPRLKGIPTLGTFSSSGSLNKQGTALKDTFTKVGKFLESLLIEMSKQRSEQGNMNEQRQGSATANAPTDG